MTRRKVIIMGAAGRDFHNFNVFFRERSEYEVVAFTAAQIPGIANKLYPPALAGKYYPSGIPIHAEEQLGELIRAHAVDVVVFAYSDVAHEYVMHKAAAVIAAGADFWLQGPAATMLKAAKPLISVCAVRTGCGKSQTTRKLITLLRRLGKKPAAIRHAMPYGDLERQKEQRFATLADLQAQQCTIEEMEEYEPFIELGAAVFAGVDYKAILRAAEREADVIIWDGGNNDFPFYHPDLEIVVVDPHRAGQELSYFPGEVNLRRADVIVINKIDSAERQDVQTVRGNMRAHNPRAAIIEAASPLSVEGGGGQIANRRVLVVEDGPTLTHGGMPYGAGTLAARRHGAKAIVDPRPWLRGSLQETFARYPRIGALLPAMGYGPEQMRDLEHTINSVECDLVITGTPIDLARVIKINKPTVRVRYELEEIGQPDLESVLSNFFRARA